MKLGVIVNMAKHMSLLLWFTSLIVRSCTSTTTFFLMVYVNMLFHWQNNKLNLLRRWDNSAHHQHIATFPYHLHTPKGIEESMPITLGKILEYINKQYPFKTL